MMIRLIRVALLAVVPMVAMAALPGCDDDTTGPDANDLAVRDLAVPRDLAQDHD
jgi:hypothetical protein